MIRFVVRPTGPNVGALGRESDGYSVYDTHREDAPGNGQIGRGLHHGDAWDLATLLSNAAFRGNDNQVRAVLAACADAADDYLPDDEKRANREAHEKSAEQIGRADALLRDVAASGVELQDIRLRYVVVQIDVDTWERIQQYAREALGE